MWTSFLNYVVPVLLAIVAIMILRQHDRTDED